MKKKILIAAVLTLALGCMACQKKETPASVSAQSEVTVSKEVQDKAEAIMNDLTGGGLDAPGGWTILLEQNLSDEERDIFAHGVASEAKHFEAVELMATQLVAGMNYCFLGVTGEGDAAEYVVFVIYNDLQGNASVWERVEVDSQETEDASPEAEINRQAYDEDTAIALISAKYGISGEPFFCIPDHEEDGKTVLHLYESVKNETEQHAATIDWVTVDLTTGECETFFGETFCLDDLK